MKLHQQKTSTKTGFTIVEVTIVTAFVAMLLIAITVIIAQMSSLYQKGLTLKAINSVGRNLISEFTSSINAAPSVDSVSLCSTLVDDAYRSTCEDDGAFKFIFQDYGELNYSDPLADSPGPVQYAGVFCTGEYSYVWNTFYGQKENQKVRIKYQTSESAPEQWLDDFKLVRFKDLTYRACSGGVNKNYQTNSHNPKSLQNTHIIDMTQQANGNLNRMTLGAFQEGFLDDNSSNLPLELYEFTIFPVSQDWVTLRAFFSGTFILATERGNVSITRTGDYCDVSNYGTDGEGTGDGSNSVLDLGSNFNYCGINKFNFAARTAGSGV